MSRGLTARLRAETAELHKATEATVGVPALVQTREQYANLLKLLAMFYSSAQGAMEDVRWSDSWAELGIDISSHSRLALLEADLGELGSVDNDLPSSALQINTFGAALGCLYVVEGSSLGGLFIGPAIRQRIRLIPTSFYDGLGRGHPKPWRIVQAALAAYDLGHSDLEDVIDGAKDTFVRFGEIVAPVRWTSE